ncbi:MAG: TraB/GumN family protein [Desulfobacterales bacterium]
MTEPDPPPIHRLIEDDREFLLLGTAHVSAASVRLVTETIREWRPDTVCLELCPSRYQALRQGERWRDTDILRVLRDKKASVLLVNLLLASFQKRIARGLAVEPGAEMRRAAEAAEEIGAQIRLVDRDIRVSLTRLWRGLSLRERFRLLRELAQALFASPAVAPEEIERLKRRDVLEAMLAEIGRTVPTLKRVLLDERDRYLAAKIRQAPGGKVLAVVGAGHLPGILARWGEPQDPAALEKVPPPGRFGRLFSWSLPLLLLALFAAGFTSGGGRAGADMITLWALSTGLLSGLGAAIALAHPVTILSAVLAAPVTTLHPLVAAGWVSGLVEAFSRRPRVRDLEGLPEDILSVRGFWRNQLTRILLVVVFTNLGAALGTLIAFPLLMGLLAKPGG